jgi:hypothetical protein
MENSFTLQFPLKKDFRCLFNYLNYLIELIIKVITIHLEFS